MRILMVGDVHGNDRFFEGACDYARLRKVDALFQLGDFGYWEHYPEGKRFLSHCEEVLLKNDLKGYWLDGNHENHPLLWASYGTEVDGEGFWKIRENLHYAPRGHRWTWDDTKFLALGGAYSIDKDYRHPGTSWWATETISDDEVALATQGGPVDVLLSHDAPLEAVIPSLQHLKGELFPESYLNRRQVTYVVEKVKPTYIFHGHYHDRYTQLIEVDGQEIVVEGLGADMSPGLEACVVFDTESLRAGPT